jgi:hypothetical protein
MLYYKQDPSVAVFPAPVRDVSPPSNVYYEMHGIVTSTRIRALVWLHHYKMSFKNKGHHPIAQEPSHVQRLSLFETCLK